MFPSPRTNPPKVSRIPVSSLWFSDRCLASSGVLWEYTEGEKLQGPFTTEQMIGLVNMEGKLDREKVRCRRVGTEQFYSIKRINFDLYLD
jgi:hypothetical protein